LLHKAISIMTEPVPDNGLAARFASRRVWPAATLAMIALAMIVVAAAYGLYGVLQNAASDSSGDTFDWQAYGRDPGGSRFSPVAGINRTNVKHLEAVWVYRTGDWSDGTDGTPKTAFEATPIVVDGTLYVSTIYGRVFALDPETGEERWIFDPEIDRSIHRSEIGNRGVATWVDPARSEDDPQRRRIFVATIDARLIAVDALSGRRCTDFGTGGEIDLAQGVDFEDTAVDRQDYGVTSAPAIIGDLVVVGSAIGDNRAVTVERGLVRAFDTRSGDLRWYFDPIPRDKSDPAWATWQDDSAARTGAGNVWAPISVDPKRDLVFVPTSSPSPDYFGGKRLGSNEYTDSVVALRGSTGEIVWHYQIVHHDLWDYDLPAQPTLVTVRKDGRDVPAVAQATKMGFLFLLDRETGEPIFPVEERPVPASDVAGEESWPTQRFPTVPAPLATATATPDDAWGLTPWDKAQSRKLIEQYRYDGIYTPPSLRGSIEFPGIAGGTNWGSVAFEPRRGLVVLNMSHVPFVVRLIPREEFDNDAARKSWPAEYARQLGTPYVMGRRPLLSPLDLPCTKPPWGTLAAVDVSTGAVRWEVPLGTIRDLAPFPLPIRLGVPNMGGPIVTGGDLVFIGAAADDYFRAFDIDTGQELWKRRLPAGGQATPMTYRVSGTGKQFVVIAAGGHSKLGTTLGDYVVAFALRDRGTLILLWFFETVLATAAVLFATQYMFPQRPPNDSPISRGVRWGRRAVRTFGAVLLLSAVGLMLPWLLGSDTWLTPFCASVLAVGLLSSIVACLARRSFRRLAVDVPMFALAGFVAYSQMSELFWVGVLPW
jgi:quinoprotein glucose dehydrogenase